MGIDFSKAFTNQHTILSADTETQTVSITTVSSNVIDTTAREVIGVTDDTKRRVSSAIMPSSNYHHTYPQPSCSRWFPTPFEILKSYVVHWENLPEVKETVGGEHITQLRGGASFSPAFNQAIGTENTINIHGLDDGLLLIEIFMELVNREATIQYLSDKNNILKSLLNINEYNLHLSGSINEYGQLYWTKNWEQKKQGMWVDLICDVFNIPRLDAIATLAKIVRLQYKNLIDFTNVQHAAEYAEKSMLSNAIPDYLSLTALPSGSACVKLMETYNILGNAGQTIGAIVRYHLSGTANDCDFCFPATVGYQELSISKVKPTSLFLNQHLIGKYPFAIIVLCQDIRTALILQRQRNEIVWNNSAEIIITAHLDKKLEMLPLNYLYGHDVVLVTAPSKQELARVGAYAKKLKRISRSFKVYTRFLLHSQPACNLSEGINGVSEGENMLLKNSIYLEDKKQPSQLLRSIVDEAIPYDDFVKWEQDMGVFKKRKSAERHVPTIQTDLFMPQSLALGGLKPLRIENELDALITKGNLTLLWGPSNVGKSYAALEIARAMICGGSAFGLRSAGGKKVYYLDGEQDSVRTEGRLCQLYGGDLRFQQQIQEAFFYQSLDSHTLGDPDAPMKLADAAVQCGIDVIIIDNLISLFPKAKQNPNMIMDFIHSLEIKGIAAFIVHHSEKTGQVFLGASELGALSKNIFKLMPVNPTEWEGNEKIQEAMSAKGPLVYMTLEKTKVLPRAEGNFVITHLPIDGQWKVLEGEFQPAEEDMVSQVKAAELSYPSQVNTNLSPDERKVVGYITSQGSVKREDIEALLGCKEDKAGKILKTLCDAKIIVKDGASRNTYYKLPDKV
jgi:hypothetical protein